MTDRSDSSSPAGTLGLVPSAAPGKDRYRASNSFRPEEVDAMLQLFAKLYKGGDVGTIVRSAPVGRVWGKFRKMQDKLDAKG